VAAATPAPACNTISSRSTAVLPQLGVCTPSPL
jgi:hypothetical protein